MAQFSLAALDAAAAAAAAEPAPAMSTEAFCGVAEHVSLALGQMGFAFGFAKADVDTKHASLVAATGALPTLAAVLAADVAAGTVKTSNHPTRNLLRLKRAVAFVAILFGSLLAEEEGSEAGPSAAASAAYDETMSPYHLFPIRMTVRLALRGLPADTAGFWAWFGEELNDETRAVALRFCENGQKISAQIDSMFEEAGLTTDW